MLASIQMQLRHDIQGWISLPEWTILSSVVNHLAVHPPQSAGHQEPRSSMLDAQLGPALGRFLAQIVARIAPDLGLHGEVAHQKRPRRSPSSFNFYVFFWFQKWKTVADIRDPDVTSQIFVLSLGLLEKDLQKKNEGLSFNGSHRRIDGPMFQMRSQKSQKMSSS